MRAVKQTEKSLLLLWGLVIVSIFLSAVCLRTILFRQQSGQIPAFLLGDGGRSTNAGGGAFSHATIKVAGSGTNLPITRILVHEFKKLNPGILIAVYESIGSGGAVRAMGEGAIDIGLVSRPLCESERREDFEIIRYGRTIAAVGVNPSVKENDITTGELIEIYDGRRRRWKDGSSIAVLQREISDSTNEVFFKIFPAFKKSNEAAYSLNRWRVIFTDENMLEALEGTEGAVGITDTGAIIARGLSIKVLSLNGVAPTPENVSSGSYPLFKDLSFIIKRDSSSDMKKFVDFCLSKEGKEILERYGYITGAP